MTEATSGTPASGNLPPITDNETLRDRTLEAVGALDHELLERADTRPLIEMGAELIGEVTEMHGTPDHPQWYAGTVEDRVMTYHNGGEDGHSSSGELGIGVPRAALMIAGAVNHAAGRDVYSPLDRATGFLAGAGHDHTQNCGRALLPEGQQSPAHGDERISAETVRDRLLAAGADAEVAQTAYDGVMATAFDPNTKTQSIIYAALEADPGNATLQHTVLMQELVGAADLLSLTHIRGPVGSVENVVEVLASHASGQALQEVLRARGVATDGVADMGELLDVIGQDEGLRTRFSDLMEGQSKFFGGFQFSDRAIRAATGGQGIDDLFSGRADNAALLVDFTARLRSGAISPREVWQEARSRAGYQE